MDAHTHKIKEFSPEQRSAAKSVLGYFATAFRWVILLAQMQSGKTDAYMFVAFELLREKKVKKVVILAGFQDKELIDQLKDFTPSMKLYRKYMNDELNMSFDDIEEIEDMIDANISVIYGSDLDKAQYQQAADTLFIWDESHYAQNKINRPFKFIKAVDISADGDISKLEGERNNYFMSVSATPLSEVSDSIHEGQAKKIVKMKPSKGYISVGKLSRAKKIIGFKNWEKILPECFEEQKKSASPKYSIIRIRGNKEMDKAVQIAKDAGIDYEVYDAEHKTYSKKHRDQSKMQSLNDLDTAPQRHKVIFIRGMARMGKRIPKTYISFVMETSKNPNSDVLLQGLLGRMCGYHTNEEIKIYVSENFLKKHSGMNELERYIQMMETESEDISVMPQKACNLTSVKIASENDWFTALPIVIKPDLIEQEDRSDPDYEQYEKEKLIATIKTAMNDGTGVNHNSDEKTEELLNQVMSLLPEEWIIHKFAKSNGSINDTFKEIPQLTSNLLADSSSKTINSMPGCGFGDNKKAQLNIWFYNTNKFADLGFTEGTIVLHGRTKNASEEEVKKAKIERNIPKTTKLEAFTSLHEDGEVVYGNGSYSIHAPIETWHSVSSMQKHLENMIGISMMEFEGQVMPRCIVSNQLEGSKWQGIIVNDDVLHALEKKGDIYNYINKTYNVKLRIAKTRGTLPMQLKELGQLRLSKIEW
jgi:hypothetical protein